MGFSVGKSKFESTQFLRRERLFSGGSSIIMIGRCLFFEQIYNTFVSAFLIFSKAVVKTGDKKREKKKKHVPNLKPDTITPLKKNVFL